MTNLKGTVRDTTTGKLRNMQATEYLDPTYTNIGGLISGGTNVTITGSGTSVSPYSIAASSIGAAITKSFTNASGGGLTKGQPVYLTGADSISGGLSDTFAHADLIGLVYDDSIAGGAAGNVILEGYLTANTTEWTAATGSGTLTVGHYYLAGVAGTLQSSLPTSGYQVDVGKAVDTTTLEVYISDPYQI